MTLSVPLLLQKILAAFKIQFPMISSMGTDFSDGPLRLGDKVTAHIRIMPADAAYDAGTGYENGATESRDLLVDVPVTVDMHRHVPIKFSHLWLIKDQKDALEGAIGDLIWKLGSVMVQSIFAKFTSGNVSRQKIEAIANVDLETLEQITTDMNEAGCPPVGRIGIVNSKVAGQLALDTRITSKDFYGILQAEKAYRVFTGVSGFKAIYEFPGMSENNAASQTFTAATTDIITAANHGLANHGRVRLTNSGGALPAGLAADTDYYVILLDANTFKLSLTRDGAAVDITGTGTGTHSVAGWENLIGIFFHQSAIAIRAGVPSQTAEMAAALGINQTMLMEIMKDPNSGFSMAMMKWQKTGTADLFVSPTSIWGSSVGAQYGGSDSITDKAAYRLVRA